MHYLDIETTGLDPYQDRLLSIQTHRIVDGIPTGETVVHKAWKHGDDGERIIVRRFLEETAFFTEPWTFIPVGFNLGFEMKWLFVKAKQHGVLPAHARLETFDKPRIDLKDVAVMMNGGRFKGAKLENFSGKMASGDIVPRAVAAGDYATVEHYIRQETEAFLRLYVTLLDEMPRLWRSIAPKLGVDADDPTPYRPAADPQKARPAPPR